MNQISDLIPLSEVSSEIKARHGDAASGVTYSLIYNRFKNGTLPQVQRFGRKLLVVRRSDLPAIEEALGLTRKTAA
jgi:predicted DNA-binding transcriptional regulator AlpA